MQLERPRFPRLTRRDFFQVGGVGVAGYFLLPMLSPLNVQASRKTKLRNSAEFVIFLFLEGGASQVDTFDLKEGQWTPPDFDVRTVGPNLKMPYYLLPRLAGLTEKFAIVRCCEAWESAHARAQYYIQVGHVFSPAQIKDMPSVGSVVAYEMQKLREETDFLPPFVAMNYRSGHAGLVGPAMFPATCAPMAMYTQGDSPFVVRSEEKPTLNHRREFLERLDAVLRSGEVSRGRLMQDYAAFYDASYRILDAPEVGSIFKVTKEEHERYGSSDTGDACVMARNLVKARAGTRFIAIAHNGWDLHAEAYEKKNQYKLCWDLDAALANLIQDLEARRDQEGQSLLEKTLIVVMGEFGRTPGELTLNKGRDHHRFAATALFAGAGVTGNKVIGATDEIGGRIIDYGWHRQRAIYPEDVICTIYSVLGIDWTKKITETPSGRPFYYIEDLSPVGPVEFDEVGELFV